MYVTKKNIKQTTAEIISNHGYLKKIQNKKTNNNIGWFVRKEISNLTDEAKILINISFNEKYFKKNKRFLSDELKYFAIIHTQMKENTEFRPLGSLDKSDSINEVKSRIAEIIDLALINFSKTENEYDKDNLIEFLTNSVFEVCDYYKNKKIYYSIID